MTITLGGVTLDSNLHLIGLETNPFINYSVRETLGGNNVIQTHTRTANARLSLVARHDGGSRMGTFCSSHLASIKALAATGGTYSLVHPATTTNVKILEFNVEQSDERETPGPNKTWHGEIILQEV